jgi:hypothetical protein
VASQGPLSAGAGSTSGSPLWTNPGNITASDNVRATRVNIAAGTTTGTLTSGTHGFSIPSGAAINGIVVEIERYGTGGNIADSSVRLTTGGTAVGDDKASASAWPLLASEAYATYGGASDTWGRTWTDSEINATTFGVSLIAINTHGSNTRDAQVDHIRITVYYTEGGGGAQDIAPTLLTNTHDFFAPTLSGGESGVTTTLLTNTHDFFAPTLTGGDSGVTATLLTNTHDFFAVTVDHESVGSQDIAATLLTNTHDFYAVTVAGGESGVTLTLLTNTHQFFDVTLAPGAVDITLTKLVNTHEFFLPVVFNDDQSIAPTLLTNTHQFFLPTLAGGTAGVTLALLTNTHEFFLPVVAEPGVIGSGPNIVVLLSRGGNRVTIIEGGGNRLRLTPSENRIAMRQERLR